MDKNRSAAGIFSALFANIIFGFSFIFSKTALSVSHPLIILSVRFTIAFIFLNILWAIGVFKINLNSIFKSPLLLLMGIAQPFLYFIFELYGLSLVSSALSGVIIALVPVAVMLFSSLVLKEKITLLQWIFTAVSIMGVSAISIISNNGEKNYILGIVLLIGAIICAAAFNLLSRKQSSSYSPFDRTYIMFLIGCIGFNIISLAVLREEFIPLLVTSITNTRFIISIIYLAIVSSVLAFLLYNFATSKISAVQAASFSNIIPAITVIAGVLVLKEDLSLVGMFLCAVIILGVWGVNSFAKTEK